MKDNYMHLQYKKVLIDIIKETIAKTNKKNTNLILLLLLMS